MDTFGIPATAFDLSRADQHRHDDSGRSSATAFLDTWDFEAHEDTYRTSPILTSEVSYLGRQ